MFTLIFDLPIIFLINDFPLKIVKKNAGCNVPQPKEMYWNNYFITVWHLCLKNDFKVDR